MQTANNTNTMVSTVINTMATNETMAVSAMNEPATTETLRPEVINPNEKKVINTMVELFTPITKKDKVTGITEIVGREYLKLRITMSSEKSRSKQLALTQYVAAGAVAAKIISLKIMGNKIPNKIYYTVKIEDTVYSSHKLRVDANMEMERMFDLKKVEDMDNSQIKSYVYNVFKKELIGAETLVRELKAVLSNAESFDESFPVNPKFLEVKK